MKNYLADYNLLVVSLLNRESAINTEHALDTSLLVEKSMIAELEPRRETNEKMANGKEEADTVYDLGSTAGMKLPFNMAQPHHFGFVYAYALGGIAAPSAWGTGFQHVFTPTDGMDLYGFTYAQQISQILKRRFASGYIDSFKASFAKDSWAKLEATVKATGKYTDNIATEEVTAAFNATSLTLAAAAVQGADAPTRLDNVHMIRVLVPATGEWQEVVFSVVSAATPAVITIAAPGVAATSTTYEITYVPTEDAWCTFPSRIEEPPLRVSNLVLTLGGTWNGSAFLGGRTMGEEIESVEHSFNNNVAVEFRVGGSGSYANTARRNGRVQTINLKRELRDFLLQQKMRDNEYFGLQIVATGEEFETGKNYYVSNVFPRCAVLKAPISVDGRILAEAGDLRVLEDDTYGSMIAKVGCQVATFGAA